MSPTRSLAVTLLCPTLLLSGGCSSGSKTGGPGTSSSVTLSAPVVASDFGGGALQIASLTADPVAVSSDGRMTVQASTRGAQLFALTDGTEELRGFTASVKRADGSQALLQADARTTAAMMVFLTPGIMDLDLSRAGAALETIAQLPGFPALEAAVRSALPSGLSAVASDPGVRAALSACVDAYRAAGQASAPRTGAAGLAVRAAALPGATPFTASADGVFVTRPADGDPQITTLENRVFRYVSVHRVDASGQMTLVKRCMDGATPLSLESIVFRDALEPTVTTDPGFDSTTVGDAVYWIAGLGLLDPAEPLPPGFPTPLLPIGMTVFEDLIVPVAAMFSGNGIAGRNRPCLAAAIEGALTVNDIALAIRGQFEARTASQLGGGLRSLAWALLWNRDDLRDALDCVAPTTPTGLRLVARVVDFLGNAGNLGGFVTTIALTHAAAPIRVPHVPALGVSPRALEFTAVAGVAPPAQTISVFNAGGDALPAPTAVPSADWIHVDAAQGGAGWQLSVQPDPTGLATGAHAGTVIVSSPATLQSPITVEVTLLVTSGATASGTVTLSGSSPIPYAGATVTLEVGASAVAVTGADGRFSFDHLAAGTYTVSPSAPSLCFEPPSRSFEVTGADVGGLDFVGTTAGGGCADVGPWAQPTSGTTAALLGVASSGTTTVAVGSGGTILSSASLSSWTPASPAMPAANYYMDVTFGGGQFVAVGTNGWGTHYGAIISTSSDGVAWTAQTPAATPGLNGVAWGNGTYVAVGNLGAMERSTNGVDWVGIVSSTSEHLDGVRYVNGRFVVTGHTGTVLTSANGLSWTATSGGAGSLLAGIAHGAGTYVAVGSPMAGGSARILTSTDLGQFTDVSPVSAPTSLRRVVWTGRWFVAVGTGMMTSRDGLVWDRVTSGPAGAYSGGDVTWTGSSVVAVGSGGTILTSP